MALFITIYIIIDYKLRSEARAMPQKLRTPRGPGTSVDPADKPREVGNLTES